MRIPATRVSRRRRVVSRNTPHATPNFSGQIFERHHINDMCDITLYTTSNCSRCVAVKSRLEHYGIPYTYINLEDDAELLEKMRQDGYTTAPILKHGETMYSSPLAILEFIKDYSSS